MSGETEKKIKDYLEETDGPDSDDSVREVAAGKLWQTGNPQNQAAAEAIWNELGLNKLEIAGLKEDWTP